MAPDSRATAWLIALAALLADQAVKALVRGSDALPLDVLAGLRLRVVYNAGVSFGRLRDLGDWLIVGVAALVVALAAAVTFAPGRYRPALGLMLGGAAGNLVDRLRFDGAVLDFIDTPWWPSFNLADVFIVAGTVLVVLQAFRGARA